MSQEQAPYDATVTIADLAKKNKGDAIVGLRVKVKKSFPREEREGQHGSYTLQSFYAKDDTGEIKVSLFDQEPVSEGQSIVLSAMFKGDGTPVGCEVDLYKNNRQVKVTKQGIVRKSDGAPVKGPGNAQASSKPKAGPAVPPKQSETQVASDPARPDAVQFDARGRSIELQVCVKAAGLVFQGQTADPEEIGKWVLGLHRMVFRMADTPIEEEDRREQERQPADYPQDDIPF